MSSYLKLLMCAIEVLLKLVKFCQVKCISFLCKDPLNQNTALVFLFQSAIQMTFLNWLGTRKQSANVAKQTQSV